MCGGWDIREISVPFSEFYCEYKISLKNLVYLKKKNESAFHIVPINEIKLYILKFNMLCIIKKILKSWHIIINKKLRNNLLKYCRTTGPVVGWISGYRTADMEEPSVLECGL